MINDLRCCKCFFEFKGDEEIAWVASKIYCLKCYKDLPFVFIKPSVKVSKLLKELKAKYGTDERAS